MTRRLAEHSWRSRAAAATRTATALACASLATAGFFSCAMTSQRFTAPPTHDLAQVTRWWILIGHSNALDALDWRRQTRDVEMVVLSDDPRIPVRELAPGILRLAYLSVGEADRQRPYWPAVEAQPFLVETNPHWPDNYRVDLRDQRWQRILLDQEIPRLLERGFQGLMLDTIDTAPYLETKDPVRFAGARQALRSLLASVRDRYPGIALLANGTEALQDAAPVVDGYVVEGLFATYDFNRHDYRPTTDSERTWKLAQIDLAQARARRPVFSIEYASVGDVALSRWAAAESVGRGFRPYVTVKDINTLP